VDGIHLDYVRYGTEDELGFHPEALRLFARETGWSSSDDPEMDADFASWRRSRIADLVHRIALGIRAERSGVALSAFVIGYVDPVAGALTPVDHWASSGDLSFLVGGQYTTDPGRFEASWVRLAAHASGPADLPLCAALGTWLEGCGPEELTRQIRFLREAGGAGFVCFDYRALTADEERLWRALTAPGGCCEVKGPGV